MGADLVRGDGRGPGAVARLQTRRSIVREDAPGLIITRGVQDDPVQIWTKGAAVGMPVMHTPDAHIVAKVL